VSTERWYNRILRFFLLLGNNLFSFREKDSKLCDGINCQNKGVCANRVIHGTLKPICLCPYGTFGDYCHLLGKKFKISRISTSLRTCFFF